jgi:hypothetical protein
MNNSTSLRQIRVILILFVIALLISGATAIPLRYELKMLNSLIGKDTSMAHIWPSMGVWVSRVYNALEEMDTKYAFLAYGYDWLAFGHFAIAILLWGAVRDPLRNRWAVEAGMIACVLVVPYAIVFGQIRGIPIFWRVIDTLFGLIGIIPLWYVRHNLMRIEENPNTAKQSA